MNDVDWVLSKGCVLEMWYTLCAVGRSRWVTVRVPKSKRKPAG